MDRRQIAASLVLKHLDIKLEMNSFDQRLLVQKALYLAQAAGLDLGYSFRWYIRGPYCPTVAQDLFAAIEDPQYLDRCLAGWSLDTSSMDRLASLRTVSYPAQGGSRARHMELLASVHFLIDRKQIHSNEPAEISKKLGTFGKRFTADEVRQALSALRKQRFLKN